jgi:hypothetical protein
VIVAAKRRTEAKAPPGEQDLLLKLAMRRVFWGMNYATRLNLLLALPGSRRSADELSDLDCVGFSVGGDFSVRLLIADCKSGSKVSPASRLFWLAGVRDFFGADRGYAVLQRPVPDGVREQAARLGLDVLAQADREILENVHSPHAPVSAMFDVAGVTKLQQLSKSLDGRLDALVRFRDHTYWHLPPERRLQRLLVELRSAAPHLDVRQRGHVVLVIDILFLLTLSLLGACRHVSATDLANPRRSLLEYLLGGAEQTRAREQGLLGVAQALRALRAEGVDLPDHLLQDPSVEPEYFPGLLETVARMLRRPRDAQRLLRYLEWWGQAQVGLDQPPVTDALGAVYGDYTRKLVSDIARMAFVAAKMDKSWLELGARAANGQPVPASGPDNQTESQHATTPSEDDAVSGERPKASEDHAPTSRGGGSRQPHSQIPSASDDHQARLDLEADTPGSRAAPDPMSKTTRRASSD